MFRVILIDDNPIILNEFKNIIISIGVQKDIDIDIHTFLDGHELLSYVHKNRDEIDLICLDLMMNPLSGTEVANQLREENVLCDIVFLTSSDEYRFQFAGKDFFHYVLKGKESEKELTEIISNVYEGNQHQKQKDTFNFAFNGSAAEINVAEIINIERIDSEKVLVFCRQKMYEIQQEYEPLVDDFQKHHFINIDYMNLVNLAHIKNFEEESIILANDKTITTSAEVIKEVKALLAQYLINSI